jgi:hypothetical protein
MPTYSDFATAQMNATGVEFCADGAALIGTHTAQEAYDQPNPLFWMWALFNTNRSVCNQLVSTMMQNLWNAGASADCPDLDPVGDPAGFLAWHAVNKGDRAKARSCHVAFAFGSRIVLDQLGDLSAKVQAFCQIIFVAAYVSAMNDATGQDEKSIFDGLKAWFLTQVTFDQFSAGGTYT